MLDPKCKRTKAREQNALLYIFQHRWSKCSSEVFLPASLQIAMIQPSDSLLLGIRWNKGLNPYGGPKFHPELGILSESKEPKGRLNASRFGHLYISDAILLPLPPANLSLRSLSMSTVDYQPKGNNLAAGYK